MLRATAFILSLLLVGGLFAWQFHVGSERYPMPEPGPELTTLLESLDLSAPPLERWVRITALDSDESFRVQFLRRGSGERFVLVLTARDDNHPAYAHTEFYNVFVESPSQGSTLGPKIESALPTLVKWVEKSEAGTSLVPMPERIEADSELQRKLDRLRRLEARKRWEIDRFGRSRLLSRHDAFRSHVEDARWLALAGLAMVLLFIPGWWKLHANLLPEETLDRQAKNFGQPFLLFAVFVRLSAHALGLIPPLDPSHGTLSAAELPPTDAFAAVLLEWGRALPFPIDFLATLADTALFAGTVYLLTYFSLRLFGKARAAIWSGALFALAVCNWAPQSHGPILLLTGFLMLLCLFSFTLALTMGRPWYILPAFVLAVVAVRLHPATLSLALLSPIAFWAMLKRWEFYHFALDWLLPLGLLLFAAPLVWQYARWEPLTPVWQTWSDPVAWLGSWIRADSFAPWKGAAALPVLALAGLYAGIKGPKKQETWLILAAWLAPWAAGFLSADPAVREGIGSQWIWAPCLLGGLGVDRIWTGWEAEGRHERKPLFTAVLALSVLLPAGLLLLRALEG